MYVVNSTITLTFTFKASLWKTGKTSYHYVITNPDKSMSAYSSPAIVITNFSATVDGTYTLNFAPTTAGLYKIVFYQDSDTSFGSGNVLGETLINVVSSETTGSVTFG